MFIVENVSVIICKVKIKQLYESNYMNNYMNVVIKTNWILILIIIYNYLICYKYIITIIEIKLNQKVFNFLRKKEMYEILCARRYFATGRFLNQSKKFCTLIFHFRIYALMKRSPEVIFINILFRVNYFLLLIIINKDLFYRIFTF